jgi:hypothetical protein
VRKHGTTTVGKASTKYWLEIQYWKWAKKPTRYIGYSEVTRQCVDKEAEAIADPQVKSVIVFDKMPKAVEAIAL